MTDAQRAEALAEARKVQYENTKDRLKLRKQARMKVVNRVCDKKWATSKNLSLLSTCSSQAEHYHHEDYDLWLERRTALSSMPWQAT